MRAGRKPSGGGEILNGMQPQLVREPGLRPLALAVDLYREAKTMSSWARMQPVGKSGQLEQTGFLTRMGIAVIKSPTGIGLGRVEPPFSILGV